MTEVPTIGLGIMIAVSSFFIFRLLSEEPTIKSNTILSIIVASFNGAVMTILVAAYKWICNLVV
jgi:hypothetical protein